MMPASAMKPIIEVAVNGAPNSQCPATMPISVSGTGVRMTSGSQEAAELPDHEHIDGKQRDAERGTHVAEGHIGDLPFAIPEQGRV